MHYLSTVSLEVLLNNSGNHLSSQNVSLVLFWPNVQIRLQPIYL